MSRRPMFPVQFLPPAVAPGASLPVFRNALGNITYYSPISCMFIPFEAPSNKEERQEVQHQEAELAAPVSVSGSGKRPTDEMRSIASTLKRYRR